ncbi:F-box protein [Nymphaea thermarum]|nr:F-box protein [Nymphaea thermarum]
MTLPKSPEDRSELLKEAPPLIPGLPDDVAELCLLRLPFPHHATARSVSSSWNKAISDPSFSLSKKALDLSLPYLFVLAYDPSSCPSPSSPVATLHCHAFNPRTSLWFSIPPPPSANLSPPSSASASLPHHGTLFLLGGLLTGTDSPVPAFLKYTPATNSWSPSAPMPTARSFFSATTVAGKIVAVGDGCVDTYEPSADAWTTAAGPRLSPYDVAVIGRKMYVTEGWAWPFDSLPRGAVYDAEKGKWGEMKAGMREGWTGASAVAEGQLLVVSEHRGTRVKAYVEERDEWEYVGGGGVPWEVKRPLAVTAVEGKVYVVGSGLSVAVGTLRREKAGLRLEWVVVESPPLLKCLVPTAAHLLYA